MSSSSIFLVCLDLGALHLLLDRKLRIIDRHFSTDTKKPHVSGAQFELFTAFKNW